MNNPHSTDPKMALATHPLGATGWRLWKMVHDVVGTSMQDYESAFDRRNLVNGLWDEKKAAVNARKIMRELPRGVTVVVFGSATWRALGFEIRPVPGGYVSGAYGGKAYFLPHPSGRCRWYNDQLNRWNAGRLLADLAERKSTCAA